MQSGMTSQEQAYGYSVPDSFTHGTSEQRMRWFKRGYQYGDLNTAIPLACQIVNFKKNDSEGFLNRFFD